VLHLELELKTYNIYRTTNQGVYGAPVASVPAGTTGYVAAGLPVSNTYWFTVTAVDTAGNESPKSNEVSKVIN